MDRWAFFLTFFFASRDLLIPPRLVGLPPGRRPIWTLATERTQDTTTALGGGVGMRMAMLPPGDAPQKGLEEEPLVALDKDTIQR